jgi:PAS domain S-box-containing protein
MNAGFGIALTTLIVIGYLYYLNVRAMNDFDRMVERSHAVILKLEGLLSAMKDVENGEHIFTITGEESYLEPYRAAIGQIDRHLASLKTLTNNHPAQQNRVYRVEPLIREKLAETAKTIDVRKREGYLAASQREFTGRHKLLTDEICGQLAEAQSMVMQHLDRRKALKEASTRNMIYTFFAGSSLSIVLLLTIYVLIKRDITKRKLSEKALRFSEARYRALFRDNPTMIVTLDADLTMLSVNPFCAGRLGYTTDELEGRSVLKLFHKDDHPAVSEQLQTCLQNLNQVYHWQMRKICKDGGVLWVEETAQTVYDPNGMLNILVVCQDITERKTTEEAIERLNAELAARAAALEEVNRELETFNYTAAHDLRQPLNLIGSYCQVINELCGDKLDEQCRRYIQETYDGTRRMSRLIETLLDFSRLVHVELNRDKVDLSRLAKGVVEELKGPVTTHRVDIRIAEGIVANGDANLLRVVLANLLGNAWKYTFMREEAEIEFGETKIDDKPVYFVRDNGNGFNMADANLLFAPFKCLPGNEEFRGFGIGLATVERIIRRHGGRVWAESEPGKGTTFYFTLSATGGLSRVHNAEGKI